MQEATGRFMTQKSALESKALASQEEERPGWRDWMDGGEHYLVGLMRAVAAGEPGLGLSKANMGMILWTIFGADSVEEFIAKYILAPIPFKNAAEAEEGCLETFCSLFLNMAFYLQCAIDTAKAARDAGLDIGVAIRDLDARVEEARLQGRYTAFLLDT
jgi:hypothetical protein